MPSMCNPPCSHIKDLFGGHCPVMMCWCVPNLISWMREDWVQTSANLSNQISLLPPEQIDCAQIFWYTDFCFGHISPNRWHCGGGNYGGQIKPQNAASGKVGQRWKSLLPRKWSLNQLPWSGHRVHKSPISSSMDGVTMQWNGSHLAIHVAILYSPILQTSPPPALMDYCVLSIHAGAHCSAREFKNICSSEKALRNAHLCSTYLIRSNKNRKFVCPSYQTRVIWELMWEAGEGERLMNWAYLTWPMGVFIRVQGM